MTEMLKVLLAGFCRLSTAWLLCAEEPVPDGPEGLAA